MSQLLIRQTIKILVNKMIIRAIPFKPRLHWDLMLKMIFRQNILHFVSLIMFMNGLSLKITFGHDFEGFIICLTVVDVLLMLLLLFLALLYCFVVIMIISYISLYFIYFSFFQSILYNRGFLFIKQRVYLVHNSLAKKQMYQSYQPVQNNNMKRVELFQTIYKFH